jgi:serine/threonine protein kinase
MIKISIEHFEKKIQDLEEELKQKMLKEKDLNKDEQLLLQHNIVPLRFNEGSSFLGQGAYSTVYDCMYEGKHCVAKVTKSSNDVDAVTELVKIKSRLGPLGKHILNVVKIINDDRIFIILVEFLKPTNIHIKDLFWNQFPTKPSDKQIHQRKQVVFQDKIIKIIAKNVVNKVSRNSFSEEFCELLMNLIISFIKTNKERIPESSYYLSEELKESFLRNNDFLNHVKTIPGRYPTSLADTISDILFKELAIVSYNKLPTDNYEENNSVVLLPEVRSLFKCLKLLADMGILFRDLHVDNVMERNDGTLVISDPGRFGFSN